MGGAPEQAVADGKGTIFDNLEDKNENAGRIRSSATTANTPLWQTRTKNIYFTVRPPFAARFCGLRRAAAAIQTLSEVRPPWTKKLMNGSIFVMNGSPP